MKDSNSLGQLLVRVNLINEDQLNRALEIQKESKDRLGTVLIENNIITEDQLIESQTDNAQDQIDRELLLSGEVVPAHKDIFHAEQVVDDDRDGKTDHTRDEIRDSDKVADCVQSRVDHKAQGAYHAEFQELLYDFTQ